MDTATIHSVVISSMCVRCSRSEEPRLYHLLPRLNRFLVLSPGDELDDDAPVELLPSLFVLVILGDCGCCCWLCSFCRCSGAFFLSIWSDWALQTCVPFDDSVAFSSTKEGGWLQVATMEGELLFLISFITVTIYTNHYCVVIGALSSTSSASLLLRTSLGVVDSMKISRAEIGLSWTLLRRFLDFSDQPQKQTASVVLVV